MSAQRARSAVGANHRSIHPNIPGVPWWAALLIAITATAVGYAIDAGSGDRELTHVFAGFYITGCIVAVLAVRQEGVFTAIIQPPLILFCAVPGAYWMFHGRKLGNLKDLLINCGYPLIERFPLMLGTAGGVLLIGLVRWYFGMSRRDEAAADTKDDADVAAPARSHSFVGAIGAKLNSFLGLGSREDDSEEAPSRESKRTRAGSPPRKAASRTGRAARDDGSASRPSRTHSRRGRPLDEEDEPRDGNVERPRRRRPAPPRDVDPAESPRRSRRRPRPQGDPDPHETRRDPRRRNAYERPYERPYEGSTPRGGRFDGYEGYEPPPAPEHVNRYEPSYEPPRRRRATPGGPNGATPTHHPISRVRYRGEAPLDEHRAEPRAEPRAERRGRPRSPRPAESWEYDV